jgi:hypothetical protein
MEKRALASLSSPAGRSAAALLGAWSTMGIVHQLHGPHARR